MLELDSEVSDAIGEVVGNGGVRSIALSPLNGRLGKKNVYSLISVTTKEEKTFTVLACSSGYKVLHSLSFCFSFHQRQTNKQFKVLEGDEKTWNLEKELANPKNFFESLHGLLMNKSPSYNSHFHESLFSKLSALSDSLSSNQLEEDEDD
jgi:hypothetical protein